MMTFSLTRTRTNYLVQLNEYEIKLRYNRTTPVITKNGYQNQQRIYSSSFCPNENNFVKLAESDSVQKPIRLIFNFD